VPRTDDVKTVFKVSTPVATSAVRGTEQNVSYGPERGMVIEVVSGEVEGENNSGITNLLTGRQKFVQSNLSGQPQHLLQEARDNSIIQTINEGITPEEREFMLYSDEFTGSDTSILGNQSQNTKFEVDVIIDF